MTVIIGIFAISTLPVGALVWAYTATHPEVLADFPFGPATAGWLAWCFLTYVVGGIVGYFLEEVSE